MIYLRCNIFCRPAATVQFTIRALGEMTDSEKHIIALPQGQIEGVRKEAIYGQSYYSFEGIPYGKPPLGELRFKAPQPAEPWKGIKDCTRPANKPTQKEPKTGAIEGAEDCLYLNVYAKKLKSDKPLPVMFYIYGGGFFEGGATPDIYGPDYLMREEIILVVFNYRLCSLGFLSLRDPELKVPGNAGLKDQVLALKWVKKYINHFNGDANNITVFGQSAGGASVHFMAVTEQTRGLFHKAIPMSACVLNFWANTPQHEMGYRLAKYHGYEGENVDRLVLEYLQKLEPKKLVTYSLLTEEEHLCGLIFEFGPTVEPYVGEDCIMPKSPLEMVRNAWSNNIPMMIGATSDEGIVMYPLVKSFPPLLVTINEKPEYLLPAEVREKHSAEENGTLGAKLRQLHLEGKVPSSETMGNYMDLYSHRMFLHGIHRTVLARQAYASSPTYVYRFNVDSPHFNHYRKKFCGDDPVRGVAHADDLSYMWHHDFAEKLKPDSMEFKAIKRMVGMWTSFAKCSDPNCAEIEPTKWKTLKESNANMALNISANVEFIELPEKPKFVVWDSLYKKEDLV